MKFIFLISLILIYISPEVLTEKQCWKPASKLVLVTGMFRHGERTPDPEQMQEFPKYEYINDTFSPYGRGQLTTLGKSTMYNLGEKLRKRYAKKLYKRSWLYRDDIQMESTKYKRSLISAQIVLRGLLGYDKRDVLRRRWATYKYLNRTLNAEKEFFLKFYYKKEICPAYLLQIKNYFGNGQNLDKVSACMNPMQQMAQHLRVEKPDPLKVWYMSELYKAQI
ncbi:lysosomal acid phosphatase-like [Ctenocephalides felis]|uniref:lysosomal acid phosphatase-like n=1 Tax=Ctenocephalides felis TaxID=7515 RepID=UPI000E6E13B8|nr:lysosomal acid phosphatase-like [Ctenocephalides felis]